MFQSYENRGGPDHCAERIKNLREQFKKQKLDGFILPRSDKHLNEYVAPHDERLLWLTGFSGSAGLAIILNNKAAIFIDGRYTLQVQNEVDKKIITPVPIAEKLPHKWLGENIKRGQKIGIAPTLHSVKSYETYLEVIEKAGATLISVTKNPVDQIWNDQPTVPENPVVSHPKKYAGLDTAEKIELIQSKLKEKQCDAFVVTAPESICWLFNIRGSDIRHTPIMLANAIIHRQAKPELFLKSDRLGARAKEQVAANARILNPDQFEDRLKVLGSKFKKVLIDPMRTNGAIYQTLRASRAEIIRGDDPCSLPKAKKNKAEIEGSRQAHIRDGLAVTKFLHWLSENADKNTLDEINSAKALEKFRFDTGALKDISFETISGAGPNGAIVHYRVSEQSNRRLNMGDLYLVDSGAQYQDGTTDITRTIAIDAPTTKPTGPMRKHYTLVLKAHINLATAYFPKGTRGVDLDPLVRAPLWQAGLDFAHGTGHGVGSFLSVHEGPQGISSRATVPLEPGMIISNEPGYYREGAYGIRLENLILVSDPEDISGGEHKMMHFETLTLAPFDRHLIDCKYLDERELKWLNNYHRTVYKTLSPELKGPVKSWLKAATSPIKPEK